VIESSDEIGKLAQGFEVMRRSIRKLIADLQDEKNALESRVSDRTAELDEAFHKQEEQTRALEKTNAEMLEIQENLRESEKEQIANKERIDSILQASPDGICVIDTVGEIQMANQSMWRNPDGKPVHVADFWLRVERGYWTKRQNADDGRNCAGT
jgi:methyl-accepting chemotaxis protein